MIEHWEGDNDLEENLLLLNDVILHERAASPTVDGEVLLRR